MDVRTSTVRKGRGGFAFRLVDLRRPAGRHVIDEVPGQQLGERRGELDVGHPFPVYPDAGEDGLIEEPSCLWRRHHVGRLDAVGQAERDIEPLKGPAVIDLELDLTLLSGHALAPYALLLFGEQLIGDVVGIVGLEQLFLLASKPGEILDDLLALRFGEFVEGRDIGAHGGADLLASALGELDAGILVFDCTLDGFDAVVGLRAGALLPAAAKEVLEGPAGLTFDARVDQPPFAFAAVHRAAKVVVVAPAALAGLPLRCKHLLNLLERGFVDQGAVSPLAGFARVAHDAEVVVASQHAAQPVDAERGQRLTAPRPVAQAA
ncbi:MAG: hypothetical protein ABSG64_11380 [Solirubrobacteraceae bacterium]